MDSLRKAVQWIRQRHTPQVDALEREWCAACGDPWPCDFMRILDKGRVQERALQDIMKVNNIQKAHDIAASALDMEQGPEHTVATRRTHGLEQSS